MEIFKIGCDQTHLTRWLPKRKGDTAQEAVCVKVEAVNGGVRSAPVRVDVVAKCTGDVACETLVHEIMMHGDVRVLQPCMDLRNACVHVPTFDPGGLHACVIWQAAHVSEVGTESRRARPNCAC